MADNKLNLAEHTLDRDDEGNLKAETVFVEELDADVEARPLNKAARRKYLSNLGEGEDLTAEETASLFREHVVDPDPADFPDEAVPYDEYTAEYIDEDMHTTLEDGLFIAILLASGEDDVVEQMRAAMEAGVAPEA